MTSAGSHPRRRANSPSAFAALEESLANLSLQKGATFHSPPCASMYSPFDLEALRALPLSMPVRSSTCPKDLEDLLLGAGERRTSDFLAKVDKAIQQQQSSVVALGCVLNEPDVLPSPSFIVDQVSLDDIPKERRDSHGHASDSGLGSSIADPEETVTIKSEDQEQQKVSTTHGRDNTRATFACRDTITSQQHYLGDFAAKQIHRYLVKPILKEASLQDFHPLFKNAPRSVGNKKITTLRDLEKTLIFLAPDYSRSPSAYLKFCETTIRCLYATVDRVPESSQRLPTDRPYTNQYFSDLVTQIRRYAQILAATRAKVVNGEPLDEMDVSPTEKLELSGGMTHNGRPAELVRRKDDKTCISITTGQVIAPDSAAAKRLMPISQVDDESARRSMARRKKGELPKTYTCGMDDCDKQFNRPCDLTKHRKTHERPWKCTFSDCKYFSHGWPTEKERDRHVNDRHSDAPGLYRCKWHTSGCPYESKRESNCKSHMEKAHGWTYVRSKSTKTSKVNIKPINKGKAKVSITRLSPSLPPQATPSAASASASSSPFEGSVKSISGSPPTPYLPTNDLVDSPMTNAPFGFAGFGDHFNFGGMNFDDITFDGVNLTSAPLYPYTPSLSDDRRASHNTSTAGTTPQSAYLNVPETSFEDAMAPPTPEDIEMFQNPKGYQQPTSAMFGTDFAYDYAGNATVSPYVQQANAADPTFSMPASIAFNTGSFNAGFSAEDDFTLYDPKVAAQASADALFMDHLTFGSMGSQYGEASSNQSRTSESNIYQTLFPELEN